MRNIKDIPTMPTERVSGHLVDETPIGNQWGGSGANPFIGLWIRPTAPRVGKGAVNKKQI